LAIYPRCDRPSPGNGSAYVGTLWVAHYSQVNQRARARRFRLFRWSTCTGINSFDIDEDNDGYSNADEIANGSDPSLVRFDRRTVDGDHISDLLDQDDDNDGIDDTQDPFPLDPKNGTGVPIPVRYELFNSTGSGFYGVGLTGLMLNRGEDTAANHSR